MNIIIYDFEVFKMDVLLGTIIIDGEKETLYQTWNKEEIIKFYEEHKNDIWVGHNSFEYDRYILQGIIKKQNPYSISRKIVVDGEKPFFNIKLLDFDIMKSLGSMLSLKLTELIRGISVDTTEVDFNLNRQLTEEEKVLTEKYNQSDLYQTLYNFNMFYHTFELQLGIISEFAIDLEKHLDATGTQTAAGVLSAKRNPSLEYDKVEPIIYDNLQLKNQRLLDYYYNEEFRKESTGETIQVGNAVLTLGKGGLHYAQKKVYYDKLLYADISGAYNTVMINYNLFSRTIPQKGIDLYKYMFVQEKALKKTDPKKRKVYKTILLSVYGAQMNKYTDFYDPWKGLLVPITLQLFIVDLLEKIEDKCTFVQVNTDGIMLKVNEPYTEEEVIKIINAWEERTGFQLKFDHLYDLWQRDVNNYLFTDKDGKIEYKGEALINYDISDNGYSSGDIFNSKEPPIIAKGIINFLAYGKEPEETVEENKRDLRNFQYACKKGGYKYLTYDVKSLLDGSESSQEIQSPSRVFAWNDTKHIGMVNKHGTTKKGPDAKAKVSNLPSNVFLYNKEILSDNAYNLLKDKIDYKYYVKRIYERIEEFVQL